MNSRELNFLITEAKRWTKKSSVIESSFLRVHLLKPKDHMSKVQLSFYHLLTKFKRFKGNNSRISVLQGCILV